MKNAAQIINSIQDKPQFTKLAKFKCIKKIQSIFVPALQKMIKFAYIKNDTLFFVLNHPGAKQEFDNNIQNIKSALNFHTPDECKETPIKEIKAFVTHTPDIKLDIEPKELQLYSERASGDIEVNIKDEKLRALAKSIQEIIKRHHNS
ncbi:hypothetical protein GJV85_02535 [Sulfurimonas aquatica]|uniref:DUF721 domain-containing protein n=1 Tax=Sulfurimonas aquatica TaxID=2672570 RepID=A0A975AYP7_9BACT|nr:hypothetical protein [Sulfurimonas aquatica]QSZ41037.1 hypothetical protein GJV85_02535 [Sulfurimonas aquatica]